MSQLQQIHSAVRQVLGEQKYVVIVLLFALFFFGLFIFISVVTTPGNTLAFQLSIFRAQDYLLMIFLAFLVGLNFSMNIYAWKKQKESAARLRSAGMASAAQAGFGGVFGAIIGTATCASCLAFLFGVVGLGIGSVAFVLKYQTFFLLGAIMLVVFSIYFTARKACPVPKAEPSSTGVNRHCVSC